MLTRVRDARRLADAVRSALLSPTPEPIEQSLPALDAAVACLRGVQGELGEAPPTAQLRRQIRKELRALGVELSTIQRLAEEGARFHEGWARLLGSLAGGYTRDGAAAALASAPTLTVEA